MKTLSKLITLVLLFILFAGNSFAQDITGGTVKYEQFSKFEHGLKLREDPGSEGYNNFVSQLPKKLKEGKILFFNSDNTLFELDPNAEGTVLEGRMAGMVQRVQMGMPPEVKTNKVYVDLKKKKKTVQVDLMSRYFIIQSALDKYEWKLGTEQRKIQGYVCQQATTKKGEETITAWFAPEIPVSVGPDVYGGLPGIILAVDINGENVLLATSVDLSAPDDKKISIPKDGKKIKQKAFDKIFEEKLAEDKKLKEQREKDRRVIR